MAKDYKDRGEKRTKKGATASTPTKPGRWILIGCLVFGFIAFLVYLKSTAPIKQVGIPKISATETTENTTALVKAKPEKPKKKHVTENPAENIASVEPEFTFYTILPAGEVVVPEHEIKARIREELVGRGNATQYTLQAGAFRNMKDADHLKAELAMLGIASKIEIGLVNNKPTWHRVRLGPYTKLDEVEKIKAQLKKNAKDILVIEVSK